ncbi:MAG TPA: type II CAAX endopeptidase family protein [Enhygromyxa sp.]|nr:type II CAAX endopeptidase family protein [Enhygromyxa sp.]
MDRLQAIFWNREEQRVRALWRLIVHGVALALIGLMVGAAASVLLPSAVANSELSWPIMAVLAALIVAAASALVGHTLDRRRFDDFGLRLSARWWADFAAGVVIGALLMGGIFVVELGAGWVEIDGYLAGAGDQPFVIALLGPVVLFVGVGFYEELLFRGYQLRNMAEGLCVGRLGPRGALVLAAVLSSIVFGLAHSNNNEASLISTSYIALAGVMLALGLLWTTELALPIGLHLSWNFCQGNLFGFPVSGNDVGPRVIDARQLGDPLITGGEFGPEAGLIGVAAMVVGAGLIAAWVRLSRGSLALRVELAQWRADARS